MPGIDPNIVVHKLYVDPRFQPIKQKKRLFNNKKKKAIREEVQTLLKADAIATCPKDFYPLPCLGRLVDGSAGH
ncbi:hypothetical protein LIER_32403 [Lithospermum erythrorhizon]|uniref:Uncharacterized protein n=1 Tax=Lithospermum erythrorhizon TaxID=34254 RepID=A0AAV3RWV0_LITER